MVSGQFVRLLSLSSFITAIVAQDATSSFNMFPAVDPQKLANSLGWTPSCLAAMNNTVNCDQDLFRMAGQIDQYFWSIDNVTTLCTRQCQDDSSNWLNTVESACQGQTYSVASKLVPVDTVVNRFNEGLVLACSTPNEIYFNYTSNSTQNDYDMTDDDWNNPNSTSPFDQDSGTPISDPNSIAPSSNGTDDPSGGWNATQLEGFAEQQWCFLESQNWAGADPSPDCVSDPSNIFCTDPTSMNRLANLYYDDVLCSPCFLTVLFYRVNSLFLPDTDQSDWLISQYQDIQDVCQVSMPLTVIRAPPNYQAAPNVTYLPPGTDPANGTVSSTNCTGQTITPGTAGCDALSTKYGVTTGDLQAATGTDDCSSSSSVCVPLACSVQQTGSNASCDGLASAFSTASLNVSTTLFLRWNPNILGLCDSLTPQYVCSTPPGGAYALPPPINGTNTNAAGQERGGQGSGANPNGPDGPTGPSVNSTAAAPTQPGIAPDCNKFAYASSGDTCYGFTQDFHITLAQLIAWNPALGNADGSNCSTTFWVGYDYCVGTNSSSATTTTTSSSATTTTSSLPYPTQSGIDPNCNKFQNAVSGDYCYEFASNNGITTDQLYAWNTILGPGGADCSTEFQAGYDYCIGVSTTTTTTSTTPTTTASPVPSPTQSGIASNCNKYVQAVSGDYCYEFAQNNQITTDQLYAWNTALGAGGANCGSEFWAEYYYCVGVSS